MELSAKDVLVDIQSVEAIGMLEAGAAYELRVRRRQAAPRPRALTARRRT